MELKENPEDLVGALGDLLGGSLGVPWRSLGGPWTPLDDLLGVPGSHFATLGGALGILESPLATSGGAKGARLVHNPPKTYEGSSKSKGP